VSHRIQSWNQLPGKKIIPLKDRNATTTKKKTGEMHNIFYRHNLT
jgi:hypothetical protein